MVLWCHRHLCYKFGFCSLIFSSLVYVIAFALPYWAVLRLRGYGLVDQTVGLWQACALPANDCVSNVHGSNPPWLNAARAMCSLALILFVAALWCGYYRNFSRLGQERCHSPGRHIECISLVASLLGSAGCIIFASKFHYKYVYTVDMGQLHWAFAIVCCSLGLAGISASIMLLFNRNRYHLPPSACTLRLRGPNRLPVTVQFSAELGDDRLHIPYFGEISRDQVVLGASPTQPPAYDVVTGGVLSYSEPPGDVSDAPPLYEEIIKETGLSPEVVAQLQNGDKTRAASDPENGL